MGLSPSPFILHSGGKASCTLGCPLGAAYPPPVQVSQAGSSGKPSPAVALSELFACGANYAW